ncbi:WD repeat-containing protein 33 [Fasciolopsis buskii]|uniref:WD repeat-containing protein 33 n=1 Tax=Fasciolopsis buskii TaxID=27845 RepID=A0A8E0S0B0_9TREM|nr:WD repeat-containing protein 33 [Fasciolopsis buski]
MNVIDLIHSIFLIIQAHESQIRCMKWSHNEEWLLTADHSGYVKYWQANMNNVEMYQAHKEPIRGVSFCPFDCKFVTCSDDSTVRIWDFHRCAEERVLRGHGSDVRSVAWHPTLSLIISGSKDAQQPIKLWDPKTGESVSTLYIHKNTCTDVAWNDNGNWFLTASRDHLIKLFDLRNLKSELQTFRGHKRDVMRVAWHPFHECLFASGSADGSIFFWLAGTDTELGAVEHAHESMIWSLAWHPFGHILVSGANDFATKFWTRNRPGDVLKDSMGGLVADPLIQVTGMAHAGGDSELVEQLNTSADMLKSLADAVHGILDPSGDEKAFVTSPDEINSTVEIPGLNEGPVVDLNVTEVDDMEERDRNKMRSTRMIPKDFVANWASTRITAMPTVMMPTPSPSQLAAAAVVAAAAVNDFAATPQYLPPVKPAIPPVVDKKEESGNSDTDDQSGKRTDSEKEKINRNFKHERARHVGDASRSGRGPGASAMNYLGQPPPAVPGPPELSLPAENEPPLPPPPHVQPPPPQPSASRSDWNESGPKWGLRPDSFNPHSASNGSANRPSAHHPYPEREPFGAHFNEPFNPGQKPHLPVRHMDEFKRVGNPEDRGYQDFDDREPPTRTPNDYYGRAGQHPNYNTMLHTSDQPHPGRRDLLPMGEPHGRHFPPPPPHAVPPSLPPNSFEHPHSYDHRGAEPYPPREPPYPYPPSRSDNWKKPWPDSSPRQEDFGYPPPGRNTAPQLPRAPGGRFPPPHPPSSHDMYRGSDAPPGHDGNYFPPPKRPAPPPPSMHPEHMAKYPRGEPSWNGQTQW